MDFHSMKRKELQKLCKEHDIPANLSNLDMVDKLSSLFKVQEKEEKRPMRKTRSCLKNCDEMLSENESDVLKGKLKKVRFSPQDDVFQLGEKSERGFVVDNKGAEGRVTRCRAKLAKTILISPVVMKKRGKSAVQEVEKEDLVVENKGGASRVTRARASLGKSVVISSPVVMKKRGKRPLHEAEKGNLAVENNVGASRVTRARVLLGEKVLTSPVVMKKRGKKAVQEDEKEDLVVENKGGASRVTRARAGKQVLISSPVVMKKRGKKAVQEEKKSQGVNAEVSENKDAEADGGITKTRQSKRNRMEFTQVEPLEENLGATEKAGRRNITRSRNQFQAKASNIGRESETRDISEEPKEVAVQVKEPSRRSGRHVNTEHSNIPNDSEMPIKFDESTRYQTRHGTKRMSVMPQMKKAKTEKPVAGNSGKKNFVVKDSPNESTKSIVPEKGSETGHIRRSKRSASGDASLVISEDADGSGTDIKTGTTKKRRRDAVLEEVPSQHTGRRVNRKADDISDKLEEETPVASGPRTRSGNNQDSLMHSTKKLNMSGNLRPSRTTGEKASPHHKRELSTVPKHSATGVGQSKTVSVTPRTKSGSGQKSFIQTAKKLRISGNSGLHKTIGDKESPHQSREFSVAPRRSETESKVRGSKSKQTPVINEHPRRFTRSALKGKTDGPAHVRGKIYQKKSQSVSKLPLSKVESSLPKVISASEGPLDTDVQSSDHKADRSTVNLALNASDLPVDETACSTPHGGSAKTSGVDLNVQESEGPELINIHEASSSYPSKLQIAHAELEVDISARGHASVERPASYDVQSSIPQIAGCSTDPISDASNSCRDIDSCAILQDSATEANDRNPVHVTAAEGLDVAVDVAFIDQNSVDDDFSSLEQMTSKGMEVSPQTLKYVEPSSEGITNVVLEGSTVHEEQSMNQLLFPEEGCSTIPLSQTGDVNEDNITATQREFPVGTNALADISLVDQSTSASDEERPQLSKDVESISKEIDLNLVFQGPTIHKDDSVYQSPLAEVEEITDNPVTDNSDAACVTQQEGSTEIDAKTPSLVHLKSADNVDINLVFQGPTIHEDDSVYQSPLAEVEESTDNPVTGNSDAACVTQQEGSTEIDAKSPFLVHLKSAGDVDINLVSQGPTIHEDDSVFQSPLAEVEEITDNPVTGNSDAACVTHPEGSTQIDAKSPFLVHLKSADDVGINLVFQGPTIHEDDAVYQSPLAEVEESTDYPVTGNSDAACVTQQEGSTEIDAKSPSPVHLKSADNADIIGDAASIDAGSVDDYLFNVKQINLSAIKEKQEVSKNVNHVVAEGSTVDEENLIAEVGECGPTEQERDIRNHTAEFAESGGVDKDSRSAKEVGEASFTVLTDQTVSMILTEEKDDTMHPEMSVQADETPNTSSNSGMQEKEFPVPNSILTTGVSILEYEFPKQEFSDTVMCSNKEIAEDSNQRLSNVESILIREESCTNKCVEFSTSEVVADSVVGGNSKPEPKDPSSPLRVTEVGNLVVEVNEELKPEDSPSNRSSDIFERAAAGGSSLRKEQCSVISADVSEHNQSKYTKDESEISKKASALDSLSQEMSDMPEFISSLTSNVTEVGHLLAEVKEQKPEDPLSLWGTKILPERADEDGSSLHKERSSVILGDGSEHNQPECAREESEIREMVNMLDSTTRESTDMPEYISVSQTPDYNIGGKCTEIDLSSSSISSKKMVAFKVDTELASKGQEYPAVGIEGIEVEETVFEDTVKNDSETTSIMYGDAHNILDGQLPTEREWESENMTFSISGDVEEMVNKNVSRERTRVISKDDVDIDGTTCPMIVHEFPSDVDDRCHTPSEDSCGKEQDMSMVKSSRNFGKQFSSQHDYCLGPFKDSCGKEQGAPMSMVKSSKNFGEEFSSQHDNIIEHVKVCSAADLTQTICEDFAGLDDQMVLEDGIELLKGNSSNLIQNLVEDSDIEIITYDVSEENRYCKDTIDSHQSEDALQQFDMNDGETDSKVKGICQENDETPILVQMDVDTNNVESSRDNLIAFQGFDQEADASGVPTKELPRNEDAMDSDALANLQYGGESVTLTAQTNEAQGVLTEELSRIEEAMVANAPDNLQYGHESLTLTGEANEAQEHKSRSNEMDGDESHFWYENIDKSVVDGKEVGMFTVSPNEEQLHNSGEEYTEKEVDIFTASLTEEQLQNSGEEPAREDVDIFTVSQTEEQLQNPGEEHAREKCPESIEIQHEAFNNPTTGDDHISGGNSVGTLNGTQLESEANKDAHEKIDCYNNNRFDEDFTRPQS